MAFLQNSNQPKKSSRCVGVGKNESGIALFMVIAAVGLLSMLVVEFAYVAQVNQAIAYGALDQTKAHYLAKAGFKLSLLRLKAYTQAKSIIKNMGAASGAVPKSMIEKIWSFPFFYPFPTNVPGMTIGEKAGIEKFQKESNLEGSFSAQIESESSRFDINSIVPGMAVAPTPSPSTSTGSNTLNDPNGQTNTTTPKLTASPTPTLSAEDARESLTQLFETVLDQKLRDDPDFGAAYRDLRIVDLVDNIAVWADRTYVRRTTNRDTLLPKHAPFYSLSELHMLGSMEDEVFDLFAPTLTAVPNSGLNVNTLQGPMLQAMFPGMTKEDIIEFIKYRDSETADHMFSTVDAFYKYLEQKVPFYRNTQNIADLKQDLIKRQIELITDERNFKITVQARVNAATRTLRAWVSLVPSSGTQGSSVNSNNSGVPPISGAGPTRNSAIAAGTESGIKVLFMTIQ